MIKLSSKTQRMSGGDQALQTLQPPNNSKRSVMPVSLISDGGVTAINSLSKPKIQLEYISYLCGNSSVGRAQPCQGSIPHLKAL